MLAYFAQSMFKNVNQTDHFSFQHTHYIIVFFFICKWKQFDNMFTCMITQSHNTKTIQRNHKVIMG